MKTSETTKPLYQRLNEERTQGEWMLYDDRPNGWVLNAGIKRVISVFDKDDENTANAQYTALAVNNLHHLAEALVKMCEWHEKQATWDKGDNGYYAAKKALNRIS